MYRGFRQPDVKDRAMINASVVAHQHASEFPSLAELHHVNKKEKKPTYKIDSAKAPFTKDQEAIGRNVDSALSMAMNGRDPEYFNQQSQQISALSQAHKGEMDQQGKQLNELQQAYKNAIDPTAINKLHNEAAHDHDYTTRGEVLGRSAGEINNPVNIFNRNTHLRNLFSNNEIFPTQTAEYEDKREKGDVTTDQKRKVVGKLLVDDPSRPLLDVNGNPVMSNGRPVYQKRNAQTVDDVRGVAQNLLADPLYKNIVSQQVSRENKGIVESESKAWADKYKDENGEFPTKDAIEANKAGIIDRLAAEDVAKNLLQMEKGYTTGSNIKTLDEPKAKTEGDRERTFGVYDLGESGRSYNTKTKGADGKLMDFEAGTLGGVEIKNEKGDNASFTLNEKTVKNALTGLPEKLLGGTKVVLEATRPGILKSNGGVLHIPKGQSLTEYLEKASPERIRKEGWSVQPISYATTKGNENGVADVALNEKELERHSELESRIKSGDLAPLSASEKKELDVLNRDARDGTVPKGKGKRLESLRNRASDIKEFYALDATKQGKKKTFTVPFKEIQGEVQSSTKLKVNADNIFDKTSFAGDVRKANEIISRKLSERPKAQKKPAPHGNVVSQNGKTYVWDGNEYIEK